MKHVIASLIVGACLLLSLTGVVFAADPHKPSTLLPNPNPTGQPGTAKMATGGTTGTSCQVFATLPGGSGSANGSPFNPGVAKTYAGNPNNPTGPGGTANNSSHAVAEYDVACFQQSSRQLK
jgi:hypothetical protein